MKVDHSEHFSRKELECHCGCGSCNMDEFFLIKLEKLRWLLREPLTITSGFRCPEYNQRAGGFPNSYHKLGQAVDIAIEGSVHRARVLKLAIEVGFTGLGIAKDFIHVDSRSASPLVWIY